MKFNEMLQDNMNITTTENGAYAYVTTQNKLLDLFATIGSLRKRKDEDIIAKFLQAWGADKLTTMKMIFYARNIRGGLGERRTFKVIIKYMATQPDLKESLRLNLPLFAKYGRWDDLLELLHTDLESDVVDLIDKQLDEDLINMENNKPVSILAKWMPSVNTTDKETNRQGIYLMKKLEISISQYRKMLSQLREYLKVTERLMSDQRWLDIDYEKVPSKAMTRYRKAFEKHNPEAFQSYTKKAVKGEAKIHSATLYPYDILEQAGFTYSWSSDHMALNKWDETLEAQWRQLPNYVDNENDVLVVADTSGSMSGRPMATSIGLAIYFAERNKGPWHNQFITFSSRPSYINLVGDTLREKVSCVPSIVDNTNLEKVYDMILDTAITNKVKPEELPKAIVVITDGEFDQQNNSKDWRFHDAMRENYAMNGYRLPKVIYWCVDSRHDNYQSTTNHADVSYASGQSASVFKTILINIDKDPLETMMNTLEEYTDVRVAE